MKTPRLRDMYTLHGLRVTGITALLGAGVPLWIVSQVLAGHQSFKMTLRYNKPGPGAAMDHLSAAAALEASGSLQQEAVDAAQLGIDELRRRYVVDEASSQTKGAQIRGFWLPMVDGICPNGATLCHEGGPLLEGSSRHGAVEGGARNCGLCRFFLTGPKFEAGQVAMVNGYLYEARRQARGLQQLWRQRTAEVNPAKQSRIDDKVAHAEEEIDLTLRTINARVRLLWKSGALAAAMAEEAAGPGNRGVSDAGAVLITRMGEDEILATLREASELGFLDEASRVAALVPTLDIQDAPIERNAAIDRLLDQNGLQPMLYRLTPAEARAVGDAFTDALRSLAPGDTDPSDHLDRIADGDVPLLGPDVAALADEMSRALERRIEISRRMGGGKPNGIVDTGRRLQ